MSNDNLFDVYLGECLAPYITLHPLKAALPVHRGHHDHAAEPRKLRSQQA